MDTSFNMIIVTAHVPDENKYGWFASQRYVKLANFDMPAVNFSHNWNV